MTDSHCERADDGRVLSTTLAAVMLILTGLGVMAWDDSRAQLDIRAPVSTLHRS